jgi:hypothetical protein
MPSQQRVHELIRMVEQKRFLYALHTFYHPEVAMQENSDAPRIGLEVCLSQEARFLEMVQTFHEVHARSFVANGDRAAIHWVFDITLKDGTRVQREEIAYQRWEGEQILCEQFFYHAPPAPSHAPADLSAHSIACVIVGVENLITLPAALLQQGNFQPGDRLLVSETLDGNGLALTKIPTHDQEA